MNRHERVKQMMLEYIEGTLSKQDRQFVRQHLKECPSCRACLEMLLSTASRIEVMLHEATDNIKPPTMLWGKILSKKQKTQRKVAVSWWKLGIITCSAIAVLSTGMLAPVFGYEGNLLNVISSSMIHNASSDLEQIMDDDLLGSLRTNEVIGSVIENADITEDDIINLIEDDFDKREIVEMCKIAEKGDWTLSEVADKRKMGFGMGRIANWAGVSVFSVSGKLIKPIRDLRDEVMAKDEFDIETSIAGFNDEGALVTPLFKEPIHLGHMPPPIVDENGQPIDQEQLAEGFANIKFRLEDGLPRPVHIVKRRIPPPNRFSISGTINSVSSRGISLTNDIGEKINLNLIDGHSSLFGTLEPGARIMIIGLLHRDGRRIVDFAEVKMDGFPHVPPRTHFPPPPPPGPSFERPGIIDGDQPTNLHNFEDVYRHDDRLPNEKTEITSPAEETKTENISSGSENNSFVNMTVIIINTNKDSITTDKGVFSTIGTELFFTFSGKSYLLSTDAPIPSKNTKVHITGTSDEVYELVIPEESLYITEAITLDSGLLSVLYPDYKIRALKTNDYTVFQPQEFRPMRYQNIHVVTLPDIRDLALAIKLTGKPMQRTTGIFTNRGIVSDTDNRRFDIVDGVTQFFDERNMKPIDQRSIKPGSIVSFQPAQINGRSIVLQISTLNDRREQKRFLVERSQFEPNQGVIILKIAGNENKLFIDDETEIIINYSRRQSKPQRISLRELASIDLNGKFVSIRNPNEKGRMEGIIIHLN